jgi:hypothetical protein
VPTAKTSLYLVASNTNELRVPAFDFCFEILFNYLHQTFTVFENYPADNFLIFVRFPIDFRCAHAVDVF